jgi:hypothetical protein
VVNHVDLPGPAEFAVVNAYRDRYPWALCPAQDAVREYAVGLAEDVAELPGISGVELESFGWYGFDHLSAHDKTGGVALTGAEQYLFSLCFCDACDVAYRAGGVHPDELRARVRAVLDPVFGGAPHDEQQDEQTAIDALLGEELGGAVRAVRAGVVDRYRSAAVGRLRELRPELVVLAHASPLPHRYHSFSGVDVPRAGELFDGLVVNCWRGLDELAAAVPAGVAVHASLLAVGGMGGRPDTLAEQALAAQAAGAAGVRLYHAGLAGARDLDGIRELTRVFERDAAKAALDPRGDSAKGAER